MRTSAPTKQWAAVAANNIGTYIVAAASYVNTTFQGGLYISADSGNTWTLSSASTTLQWSSIAICNDAQYIIAGAKSTGIYVSQDRGSTWTLKYSDSGTTLPGVAISYSGIAQYAIDGLGRVLQSTDYGDTFAVIYTFSPTYTIGYSIACDYNAYRVVAGLQFGVYYSSDAGVTWTQEWITSDGTMPAVGASTYGTSFIAAQYTGTNANPVGGVLVSTSNGSSWSYKLNEANILTAALGGSGQYMAYANNHTVYVSEDYGSSFALSLTENSGEFLWTCSGSGTGDVNLYRIDSGRMTLAHTYFHALTEPSFHNPACIAQDGLCYVVAYDNLHVLSRVEQVYAAPPTLGRVVQEEVLRSGLIRIDDIDVTRLDPVVKGYAVQGGTIRSAIEPLQRAYRFDVVQSGYVARFTPRGSDRPQYFDETGK
ncbi:hypothetical protein EON64_09815, partial [archaeon]